MDQKLVYSVLEFLENGPRSGENIEVASQCLADAYQLDLKNEEQRAQLSVQPHSLLEVFEAGLASLAAGKKAEQPAAAKGTSTNEAYEAAFSKFLSSLRKTKFFDGVVEGSAEFDSRVNKAKAKFDEKFAKVKDSQTKTPPTAAKAAPAAATAPSSTPEAVEPTPVESAAAASEAPNNSSKPFAEDGVDVEAAEVLKSEGNAALKEQKYEVALEKYDKAIEIYDTNAVYWCNRAAAKIYLGKYMSAADDCNMAIALDPKYVRGRERLASVYRHLEMPEEQEKVLREALAIDPMNERLKAEIDELTRAASAPRSAPQAGIPGMPGMSGMPGMPGMPPGGPDLSALLKNPQIAEMANQFMQSGGLQQMMNNPEMMQQAMNMFGGGGPGGPPGAPGHGGSSGAPDALRDLQEGRVPDGVQDALENNPQLAGLAEEIRQDPSAAISRAMNDPELMSTIMSTAGSLFGAPPQEPPPS